jgi:hypothetical protein
MIEAPILVVIVLLVIATYVRVYSRPYQEVVGFGQWQTCNSPTNSTGQARFNSLIHRIHNSILWFVRGFIGEAGLCPKICGEGRAPGASTGPPQLN